MPSGLTAPIYEGQEDFTFADYAMRCARMIGYLISMRDEPNDAPIPERFEPQTSYYSQSLKAARARLTEITAMTPTEAKEAADAEYEETLATYKRIEAERIELRGRYLLMRGQAELWEPPTPEHETLKGMMLDQLDSSIDYDTRPSEGEPEDRVERLSGLEWRDRHLKKLRASIAHDEQQITEEIERAAKRTAWVQQLRESLATGLGGKTKGESEERAVPLVEPEQEKEIGRA